MSTSTLCLSARHRRADRARAELQPVRATRQQLRLRPSTARARRTGRRPAADRRRAAITSPRLMSISSASIEHHRLARDRDIDRSPSAAERRARCVERRPDGNTTTASPGFTLPAATVPAKPRKSRPASLRSGRCTHCTGRRKPPSACAALDLHRFQVFEQRRAVVPRHRIAAMHQVVALQRRQRDALHVRDAERVRQLACTRPRSRRTRPGRIRPGPSCSPRAPRGGCRATRRCSVCRRVCTSKPLRASTSTTARSAVDAPVAMLRVYCSWPGQSATMNLRCSVSKKR